MAASRVSATTFHRHAKIRRPLPATHESKSAPRAPAGLENQRRTAVSSHASAADSGEIPHQLFLGGIGCNQPRRPFEKILGCFAECRKHQPNHGRAALVVIDARSVDPVALGKPLETIFGLLFRGINRIKMSDQHESGFSLTRTIQKQMISERRILRRHPLGTKPELLKLLGDDLRALQTPARLPVKQLTATSRLRKARASGRCISNPGLRRAKPAFTAGPLPLPSTNRSRRYAAPVPCEGRSARFKALFRRSALFLWMIPRLAALSSAAEAFAYSNFASSSLPAARAARNFFCPDFRALVTLALCRRRPPPWRARFAADFVLAIWLSVES